VKGRPHLGETGGQVERLEEVFAEIEEDPPGKTCEAILGRMNLLSEVSKLWLRLRAPSRYVRPKPQPQSEVGACAHQRRFWVQKAPALAGANL
jgi:uncharacterized protein DUF892